MTTLLTAKSNLAAAAIATIGVLGSLLPATPARAQNYPVTDAQRATAEAVASKGVPLSDLADNAPDRYTVKVHDTLWGISTMYLKSPWRWPELWGMNLNDIHNPHLIYPGQVLVLERGSQGAMLHVEDGGVVRTQSTDAQGNTTVRLSPTVRYQALPAQALPTLPPSYIEAFLVEPMIVDQEEFAKAPYIVATQEDRVVLSKGDRAYARGVSGSPLLDDQPREKQFRVFRPAVPLRHPDTGAILGYEASYVGKARLVRGEETGTALNDDGKPITALVPAKLDILSNREEISVGDRLLPEPPAQFQTYAPHGPGQQTTYRIVSVYGTAVDNAGQNQVVVINGGAQEGLDTGTVLAILKNGIQTVDKADSMHPVVKLPDERVGLLMVFRTFEHLSYGLILEITDGVHVGDRLIAP